MKDKINVPVAIIFTVGFIVLGLLILKTLNIYPEIIQEEVVNTQIN